jgi:hypothetical protein
MNITGVTGLTPTQVTTRKALGAVETSDESLLLGHVCYTGRCHAPKESYIPVAPVAGVGQPMQATSLIEQLAAHDIRHLRPWQQEATPAPQSPSALIAALAAHPEPRLRESLIVLFLRQPSYAQVIPKLVDELQHEAALTLRHFYTAAVYLQRLWHSTLGIYLGKFPLLPDYFGQREFGLPAPNEHFGEAGLRALAALFQEKTGYDWLSTYHAAIAHLLAQLSLAQNSDDKFTG